MAISSLLMAALIGVYLVIAVVAATEANWPRALYWVAAAVLTGSVLWMR